MYGSITEDREGDWWRTGHVMNCRQSRGGESGDVCSGVIVS